MFYSDLTPFGVDMERLAGDRLARLQSAMVSEGLGALLLTDFLNIRYATNTVMMLGLRAAAIQRFVLVPAKGEPLICQRELSRRTPYRSLRFDAFMFAMRPAVATEDFVNQAVTGIKQLGAAGERVGVDCLNLAAVEGLKDGGIDLVDGLPAINRARAVKTVDEIQLIRWTTKAKEKGYDLVRAELRRSDPPEDKLSRVMLDYLMDQGFEAGSEFISIYDSSTADSRPHNEPMGADLIVKEGDLVICDATVAGPGGYYSDFARTFSHGKPSETTKQRYKEAYHSLYEALKFVKPGPCTEAFRRFGKGARAGMRLPGFDGYHGVGLCVYESPWLRGGDPEK
jgi:Xaa-Pro aminopeptidase